MATNEFKAFATAGGANVLSQEEYLALAALSTGFQSGIAKSAEINKALRQATTGVAALTQFISEATDSDINDNGDVSALVTKLAAALAARGLSRENPFADIAADGTVNQALANLGLGGNMFQGRLLRILKFEKSGVYEPSSDVSSIIVEVSGGGGAGGSVIPPTSGMVCAGGGGQSGAYAKSSYQRNNLDDSILVVVGAGGISTDYVVSNALNTSGGNSQFGDLIICEGGHGAAGQMGTPPWVGANSSTFNKATGGNIINASGDDGNDAFVLSKDAASAGAGGSNPLGTRILNRVSNGAGNTPGDEIVGGTYGYGSGGSGALNYSSSMPYLGGSGADGVVIIYEFS